MVCDTYYPDKTSGAKLIYDLVNELLKKNQVLVIVPRNSSFNELFKSIKIYYKKNLKVIFVPCFKIKNPSFLVRGMSEFFMSYILWFRLKNFIYNFKPTSLLVYSPSIFFAFFCNKIKKNFKVKSLCILRDLFPYWAIEVGLIQNFLVKKMLINLLKNFLKIFDNIGLEAKSNIKIMNNRIKGNYFFLPNWVNIKNFKFNKIKYKKKYNLIFAGNFGGGQDLNKVIDFVHSFSEKKLNKFYFIGAGINSNKIKKSKIYNLKDKIVSKRKYSQKKYIKFLKNIDFGIVSLNDKIQSVNFPGRLFSYLMANKPIILLTNKRNELSNFIEKNKLGVSISNKKFEERDFLKINSIYRKLMKDNLHIFNILKNNNSHLKIVNQIENKL